MKIPSWGRSLGIIMIIFGGLSALSSIQSLTTPQMLDLQKNFMGAMTEGIKSRADSLSAIQQNLDSVANADQTNNTLPFETITETFDEILYMSEFTRTWLVRFGYIGIIVSFIYILGGVFLLVPKHYSIKLAIGALIISILFGVAQTVVLTQGESGGFIAISAGFSKAFSIIVDLVLLIVILVSDRSPYQLLTQE